MYLTVVAKGRQKFKTKYEFFKVTVARVYKLIKKGLIIKTLPGSVNLLGGE